MAVFKCDKGRVLRGKLANEDGITGDDLLMIADYPDYLEAEAALTNYEQRKLYVQAIVLAELSEYLFSEVGGRKCVVPPITIVMSDEPPPASAPVSEEAAKVEDKAERAVKRPNGKRRTRK